MTTVTQNCTNQIDQIGVIASNSIGTLLRDWLALQQLKLQLRHERKGLLEMSDALLSDIGMTREQATAEARSRQVPQKRRYC